MLTSTTNSIEGMEISETLGVISGLSANTRNLIMDVGSEVKNIFGGKMKANSKLMQTAQDEALQELIEKAEEIGADAIVGVKYETIKLDTGIGVYAYGTAVKIKQTSHGKQLEPLRGIDITMPAANDESFEKKVA